MSIEDNNNNDDSALEELRRYREEAQRKVRSPSLVSMFEGDDNAVLKPATLIGGVVSIIIAVAVATTQFNQLLNQIRSLDNNITSIKADIVQLRSDLTILGNDVDNIEDSATETNTNNRDDINNIEKRINALSTRIESGSSETNKSISTPFLTNEGMNDLRNDVYNLSQQSYFTGKTLKNMQSKLDVIEEKLDQFLERH